MRKIVVFTGPTGVEKNVALRAVAQEYLKEKIPHVLSLSTDEFFNDSEVQRYIQYFSLEEEVKKIAKNSIPILLEEQNPETQRRYWEKGWESIFNKLTQVPHNVLVFMELHLSYFRRQKRLILHDPKDILNLNADCFITLIDDAYAIYSRILKRVDTKPITGSYLRLQDILEWRNLEVTLSDCFAASLDIKNFIVPVKHPACMLYRLIFERDKRSLIYASYPISKPRQRFGDKQIPTESDFRTEGQKEMDENRLRLYESPNIIFDPVCIDERALQIAFQSVYGVDSIYSVPGGCLFTITEDLEEDINKGFIPKKLKELFETKGILLSERISISPIASSNDRKKIIEWKLKDEEQDNIYVIAKEENILNVYPESLSKKMIKLERYHRWPLVLEGFPPLLPDPPDLFPLLLPAEEVHSIIYRPRRGQWKSHIDTQIENRDFCFICNADCMAIYRPQWEGEVHEGVKSETKYAGGKIPRIAYCPEDDAEKGGSPFMEEYEEPIKNKEKFYECLNKCPKQRR